MEQPTLSRRAALTVAGGVAAGLAVGAPAFGAAAGDDADAIVVGGGLAGLVATSELIAAGHKVLVLDQEPEASLGGQAFWSFGGLFFVNSPGAAPTGHQGLVRAGLAGLARRGRLRPADDEDHWPRTVGAGLCGVRRRREAVLAGRPWACGVFPLVGWAERGGVPGRRARQLGAALPRHLGHRPGVLEPFVNRVRAGAAAGGRRFSSATASTSSSRPAGAVTGVRGSVLEPSTAARGTANSRVVVGDFDLRAPAVIVTSGGIGGNQDLVRQNWPARLGPAPRHMVTGVPAHVDGRMLGITAQAGGRLVNRDRMWHYTEGLRNFAPIWPSHGIRILPGPSSMWFDATGKRFQTPACPATTPWARSRTITYTGYDYSWFVRTQKIVDKEFALSGSEQNPDMTNKTSCSCCRRIWQTPGADPEVPEVRRRLRPRPNLPDLVAGMNQLTGEQPDRRWTA